MKAQKIIVLLVAVMVLIAVTLMSGCIEKTGETKEIKEEYHLIETISLINGEIISINGDNYCLLLKTISYGDIGLYHTESIVIAVYQRTIHSVPCDESKGRFIRQRAIKSDGTILDDFVIIEELKIELLYIDPREKFASVAVYKKV